MVGKFKNECPRNFWIDEIVCLRSKAYSFKCKDNIESKNKINGVSKSQSKLIEFEEYKKCLDGEENQRKFNISIFRSINYEIHLQEIKKSTLSKFDDKRFYINETKSKPRN